VIVEKNVILFNKFVVKICCLQKRIVECFIMQLFVFLKNIQINIHVSSRCMLLGRKMRYLLHKTL